MKVSGSRGAARRVLSRRLAAVVATAAITLSAAAGAAVRDTGILIGDPDPDSDAVLRVIDGERDPLGAKDEPRRFYMELMLMRAQMRMGRQLYRVGDREAGRAHFIAPAEAHLPIVRDALMERGLERVVERIEDLADAARETDSLIDVQDLYATTQMAIRRAQREVEPSLREDAAFQGQALLDMAGRAIRQFEAGVNDGEVEDELAYRVSWAYARHGERLLDTFEGLLRMSDEARYEKLVERYERFVDLWPGRTPPERIDTTPGDLRAELEAMTELVEADGD
ncbi:MAG: hypothetical protein ACOCP9_05670 [Halofilum sp. (in: g-proteobacteria)]